MAYLEVQRVWLALARSLDWIHILPSWQTFHGFAGILQEEQASSNTTYATNII
jgi:hypothetical protein